MYKYILLLTTLIFTFSCSYDLETKSQGTNKLNLIGIKLEKGVSTKCDIISNLGPPSIKSPYKNNVHYYIAQDLKKNVSEKDELINTIILEIIYNDKDIVKSTSLVESKGTSFSINENLTDNDTESRTRFNLFREILNNMRRRND